MTRTARPVVARAVPPLGGASLLCLLVLLGCDGGQPADLPPQELPPGEVPLKVRRRCPGDPGCAAVTDGKLYVGVAARDITPQIEPFQDKNGNKTWDPGEPFEDKDGDGAYDAYWMAGFDLGRLATGVHDPVWARAVALRKDETTVVLIAVDAVGLFREEEDEVRKLLAASGAGDVDLLLVHATHTHETADLVGGWGPSPVTWGINEGYQAQVRRAMASAAAEALRTARPARVTFGSIAVEDPGRDLSRYVGDTRDPVVIDNVLHTLQFRESEGRGEPIGTLVNWANHPEAAGGDNTLISSDFVHYLRERVEQRGGGTVVYVSGAIGGLLTPLHVAPLDEDRRPVPDNGFAKAEALGRAVADFALQAMADPAARTLDGKDVPLAFRDSSFLAQVDNRKFQFAGQLKTFRRTFCCYDTTSPINEYNVPSLETQLAYLQLGPASILTMPGELAPELFLGGYDGRYAGTYPLLDKAQENAPDLSLAPPPPYLVDLMDGERPHRMLFGLSGDFVGYILPRYNFVLDEQAPYLKDAPGDHYEETNSLGPLAEPQIVGTARQLLLARERDAAPR